jgi:hypothetical protein
MNISAWTKMSTATKILLVAQGLSLAYAIHKKAHVTSVVTGMTIVGVLLGEWQSQRTTGEVNPRASTISSLGQLGSLKSV